MTSAGRSPDPDVRWWLRGRVAVVTGASGGVGAAAAVTLARRGASVVLIGGDPAGLHDTAERVRALGARTRVPGLERGEDVGDAVRVAVREAVDVFGRVDIVVADTAPGAAGDGDADAVRTVTAVLDQAVPVLVDRQDGSIVVITPPGDAHPSDVERRFGVAQRGVIELTQTAAAEVGRAGVRANVVVPVAFAPSLDDFAAPTQAAAEVVAFLSSDAANGVSGCVLRIGTALGGRPLEAPLWARPG